MRQLDVLRALKMQDRMTAREIAVKINLQGQSIGPILQKLQTDGLITSVTDGTRVVHSLTIKGQVRAILGNET